MIERRESEQLDEWAVESDAGVKVPREVWKLMRLNSGPLEQAVAEGWTVQPFRGRTTTYCNGVTYVWLSRPAAEPMRWVGDDWLEAK